MNIPVTAKFKGFSLICTNYECHAEYTILDDIDGKTVKISIDGRLGINGDTISVIENEITRSYTNKSSRLGSVIRKDIEGGGAEYSNY